MKTSTALILIGFGALAMGAEVLVGHGGAAIGIAVVFVLFLLAWAACDKHGPRVL